MEGYGSRGIYKVQGLGFPKIRGTIFGGSPYKDHSIFGSILGYSFMFLIPLHCSPGAAGYA